MPLLFFLLAINPSPLFFAKVPFLPKRRDDILIGFNLYVQSFNKNQISLSEFYYTSHILFKTGF